MNILQRTITASSETSMGMATGVMVWVMQYMIIRPSVQSYSKNAFWRHRHDPVNVGRCERERLGEVGCVGPTYNHPTASAHEVMPKRPSMPNITTKVSHQTKTENLRATLCINEGRGYLSHLVPSHDHISNADKQCYYKHDNKKARSHVSKKKSKKKNVKYTNPATTTTK